jgi:hypothetical protein
MIEPQTIITRSCDKPKCEYYVDINITLGTKYGQGILTHRHCLLCKHLKRDNDFYTRLIVGEEVDNGD